MDKKEIKRLYKCAQEFYGSEIETIEYHGYNFDDVKYLYHEKDFEKFKTITKLIKIVSIFEHNKKKAYLKLINKLIKKAIRYTKIGKHYYKQKMIEALENFKYCFENITITQNSISVKDVFEELVALKNIYNKVVINGKWCDGEWENDDWKGIVIDTSPITLDDNGIKYNLGRFRIHLNYNCERKVTALDPNPCYYDDKIVHPHVNNGYLCEGEAADAITIALNDLRFVDFFDLVSGVLHTYSSSNPFCRLSEWEGQSCIECNCTIGEDEGYYCEKCDTSPICEDCSYRCSSCSGYFCNSCITKCSMCGCKICNKCVVECNTCGDSLCDDCRCVCANCGNYCCDGCCKECSECNEITCNECGDLEKCKSCNELLCSGCVEVCSCCDCTFCSEHLTDGCCSNCLEERKKNEEVSSCPA
jgi:hypothetical protein